MRTVTTPSGRRIALIEAGEAIPSTDIGKRDAARESIEAYLARQRAMPSTVLQRRGEYWYEVRPRSDPRTPRDPKTGDRLPHRTASAKRSGARGDRREQLVAGGAGGRDIKRAQVGAGAQRRGEREQTREGWRWVTLPSGRRVQIKVVRSSGGRHSR